MKKVSAAGLVSGRMGMTLPRALRQEVISLGSCLQFKALTGFLRFAA